MAAILIIVGAHIYGYLIHHQSEDSHGHLSDHIGPHNLKWSSYFEHVVQSLLVSILRSTRNHVPSKYTDVLIIVVWN